MTIDKTTLPADNAVLVAEFGVGRTAVQVCTDVKKLDGLQVAGLDDLVEYVYHDDGRVEECSVSRDYLRLCTDAKGRQFLGLAINDNTVDVNDLTLGPQPKFGAKGQRRVKTAAV